MLGQRKLLQRLGPGLMHAFIFWGFLVLPPDDPDRADRGRRQATRRSPGSATRAGTRRSSTCSACSCWSASRRALHPQGPAAAPLRGQPPRRGRPDPGADRHDRDHVAAVARHRIALGLNEWPARWSPVSNALSHLFGRQPGDASPRARVRLGARADDPRASWPTCPAPSTCTSRPRRSTCGSGAPARAAGWSRCGSTTTSCPRRSSASARARRRPDLEAGARHVLVHGVRPLPGRLPGVGTGKLLPPSS